MVAHIIKKFPEIPGYLHLTNKGDNEKRACRIKAAKFLLSEGGKTIPLTHNNIFKK